MSLKDINKQNAPRYERTTYQNQKDTKNEATKQKKESAIKEEITLEMKIKLEKTMNK